MTLTDLHETDDQTPSRSSFEFRRARTGTAYLYRSSEEPDLDLEGGGRSSVDEFSPGGIWKVTANESEMKKDGGGGVLKSMSSVELPSLCEWLEYCEGRGEWHPSDLTVVDPTMSIPEAINVKGKCVLNGRAFSRLDRVLNLYHQSV